MNSTRIGRAAACKSRMNWRPSPGTSGNSRRPIRMATGSAFFTISALRSNIRNEILGIRTMKRCVVLLALVSFGALSLVISGYQAPGGPSAAALQATKIEKVKDNLYIITGASDLAAFSGGNTAV